MRNGVAIRRSRRTEVRLFVGVGSPNPFHTLEFGNGREDLAPTICPTLDILSQLGHQDFGAQKYVSFVGVGFPNPFHTLEFGNGRGSTDWIGKAIEIPLAPTICPTLDILCQPDYQDLGAQKYVFS